MRGGNRGVRVVVAFCALCLPVVLALTFAGGAGAYVYWENEATGSIGRAANDGTHVDPNFITGIEKPAGVAVDAGHIYWVDAGTRKIGRANIDGSGVANKFISPTGKPSFLAVSGSYIVWGDVTNSTIGRANIDGSSPKSEFLKPETNVCGVAVDAGHLYWGAPTAVSYSYVGRAPIAGGPPVLKEFVKVEGAPFLCGIAVSPSYVFASDLGVGNGTNIARAAIEGGEADSSFIGDAHGPCGVAVLGGQFFWANRGTGTIGVANTDSSGLNESLVQTGAGPNKVCWVAVDGLVPPPEPPPGGVNADTTPPQTKIVKGPGKKLSKGKAKFSFSSSEANSTFTCKLDGKKPARCRSPKSYKGLKPGRHTFRAWATDAAGNKDPTAAKRTFRVPGAGAGS
jgi:hypothetical protein